MSYKKEINSYLAILFAGVLGFQSLAFANVADGPAAAASAPPKGSGPHAITKTSNSDTRIDPASLKGLGVLVDKAQKALSQEETEAILQLAISDQKVATRIMEVKKSLELTSTALRDLDREPIRNPNYGPRVNNIMNGMSKFVVVSNFVVNGLVVSKYKDNHLVTGMMAVNMLIGAVVRNFTDPNQTVNLEKIFRQVQDEIHQAQGNKSISPEVDAELKRIKGLANDIIKEKNALMSVMEPLYDSYNGVDNWYGPQNWVSYMGILYAVCKVLGEKWKPAQMTANLIGEVAAAAPSVNAAVKQANGMLARAGQMASTVGEGVKKYTAKAADPIANKAGLGHRGTQGTAAGTVTASDFYGFAVASSSDEAVIATQKLASELSSAIVSLDAKIQELQSKK